VSKANLVCDAVVWRHLVPAPLGTRSSRSRVNTRCQVAPTGSIFLYVRHDESHFVRDGNASFAVLFHAQGDFNSVTFEAHCPYCNKTVSASTILDDSKVKRALETHSNVRVMHPTPKGDHVWGLDQTAKTNLRKAIAKSLLH